MDHIRFLYDAVVLDLKVVVFLFELKQVRQGPRAWVFIRYIFFVKKKRTRMLRQNVCDDNDYVLRIALIEQVWRRESEGEEREREKINVVC